MNHGPPQPGYAPHWTPPAPSLAAARVAGTAAIVVGVLALALIPFYRSSELNDAVELIMDIASGALLIGGGVLLLIGQRAGQVLCLVAIPILLVPGIFRLIRRIDRHRWDWDDSVELLAASATPLLAFVVVVLVLLPPVSAGLARRPTPPGPGPHGPR